MTDEQKASLKDRAAEWVFQQGTSTVLLIFIAAGAWYGIPRGIESLKQTLTQMELSHREERLEVAKVYADAIKALSDQRDKDRDMMKDLIGLQRSGALPIGSH